MARGQLRIPAPDEPEDAPDREVNEALAAFGLYAAKPLDLEEEFYLWPDCVPAFNHWRNLQTQWCRTGEAGRATGLNYVAVEAYMNMRRIPAKERPELLNLIQTMEFVTLSEWSRQH